MAGDIQIEVPHDQRGVRGTRHEVTHSDARRNGTEFRKRRCRTCQVVLVRPAVEETKKMRRTPGACLGEPRYSCLAPLSFGRGACAEYLVPVAFFTGLRR